MACRRPFPCADAADHHVSVKAPYLTHAYTVHFDGHIQSSLGYFVHVHFRKQYDTPKRASFNSSAHRQAAYERTSISQQSYNGYGPRAKLYPRSLFFTRTLGPCAPTYPSFIIFPVRDSISPGFLTLSSILPTFYRPIYFDPTLSAGQRPHIR